MSDFRLPRLPRSVALVDKAGNATEKFQRWWQSVVERIEDAVNRADGAQIAADMANMGAQDALGRIADALDIMASNPNTGDNLDRIADALEWVMLAPAPRVEADSDTLAALAPSFNSVQTDYIDMPAFAPVVQAKRRLWWDESAGTFRAGLVGHELNIGMEDVYPVNNATGGALNPGVPVMIDSVSGGIIDVALADAGVVANADLMLGVTSSAMTSGGGGYVTRFGLVSGFDTTGLPAGETWSPGDLIYFRPSGAGQWTNIKPVTGIAVPAAIVLTTDSTEGRIWVTMRNDAASSLADLDDVVLGTPSAGDILIWHSAGYFEDSQLQNGNGIDIVRTDGNLEVKTTGATDTFTTVDGKTVTVVAGSVQTIV